MKIHVEIQIQKTHVLPTEEKALKAMITNWAKIYDKVGRGVFPLMKVRYDKSGVK